MWHLKHSAGWNPVGPTSLTLKLYYMSDTKLHKLKGKSQRDVIETPFEVKKYFDRKCGTIDGKINKIELKNKELEKEYKQIKELY